MITTTTPFIEGKQVQQYLGIVSAQTIIGVNLLKDIVANIKDVFSGRNSEYEKVIDEARTSALNELVQKAEALGATAIMGEHLHFDTVGVGGSILLVLVTGTAVRV